MKKGFLFISLIFFGFLLSLGFISAFNWEDGNLVSYYKLDEGSGDAIDSAGSNNLDLFGIVPSQDGIILNSRGVYSNTSNYLTNINVMSFDSEIAFSMSFWVYREAVVSSVNQRIIAAGDTHNGGFGISVNLDDNNVIRVDTHRTGVGNLGGLIFSTGSFSNETWTYVVVNHFSDRSLELYINGVLDGSSVHSSTAVSADNDITIGKRIWNNGLPLEDARVDEVGIWNRTLSASEISELYNNGTGLTFPLPPPTFENVTFENVNVINDLNVGKSIFSLNGFFDFLGSPVSRIIKGWFTEIDAINIIARSILVNGSQVCLEDGTNCLVDVDAEIKSDSLTNIAYGTHNVSFSTSFSSIPHVTVSYAVEKTSADSINVENIDTTGFILRYTKVSGGRPENTDIQWIATNVGNP